MTAPSDDFRCGVIDGLAIQLMDRFLSVFAPRGDKRLRAGAALDRVIAQPDGRTLDMGGALGTSEFGKRVAEAVE